MASRNPWSVRLFFLGLFRYVWYFNGVEFWRLSALVRMLLGEVFQSLTKDSL